MEQTSILTRFIFILFHVFRNNNMNGQTTPDEDIVKHICMYIECLKKTLNFLQHIQHIVLCFITLSNL